MPVQKFNIDGFVHAIESEYQKWNPPVITFIAQRGANPFQILASTLLSLRTRDEVTAKAAQRLFAKARTPQQIIALGEKKIKKLIYPVGFYPTKATRLVEISRIIIKKHKGKVPEDIDLLLKLPGVGRKTANLVLMEAFKKPAICVDTHVHRISNRIGYVRTKTPDETEFVLRKKLPLRHWIKYNELLVALGQRICRPISPFCSRCPVAEMCAGTGVSISR